MKRVYIISIAVIVIAVGFLISSFQNVVPYADISMARANPELDYKLTGLLVKDKPVEYNPEVNPNYMTFYLEDEKGETCKVVMHKSKPQDFERSERIVLTGTMKGTEFHASEMLLKCPSKYKDEEMSLKKG